MTLIEDVAQLKELEEAAEPEWSKGDCGSIYCVKSPNRYPLMTPYGINANAPEIDLVVALRNAAPVLLDVLGAFQEGDAEVLIFLARIHEGEHSRISTECGTVLRRLAEAARKMEAKRE